MSRSLTVAMAAMLAASLVSIASSYARGSCPSVGAIRWDAWFGKDGGPGKAVEKSLGPEKWHYRLPSCGRVVSENEVSIECDSQSVMDREISLAKQAGLDYWAFVAYRPEDPMSLGLKYYLSSPRKRDIDFALIASLRTLGSSAKADETINRFVALMKEPTYKKVLGGRPLFFVGFLSEDQIKSQWGGEGGFKNFLKRFRGSAIAAGLKDPYFVVMDFQAAKAKTLADRLGFDAISSYLVFSMKAAGDPYAHLEQVATAYWERAKALRVPVVPIAMAGWDRRPRVQNPVPWEGHREDPGAGSRYYQAPKPAELAGHVKNAIRWTMNNASVAEAQVVLIYAWNEHDEGGWIAPTLSEGTARVESLGEMMNATCPN